ncbi:hypothetical protein DM473_09425 [Lactobacillus helveticus]|uniref:hypothetical protein n=1 Tax=Lactobacillus helveticus TaxID=1587 RepID=UPI000C7C6BDE|nr:hypothetical protein [Lactobacillus helveticus]AUJ27140.1 hypothetical protein Lh8627_00720 [Lactobacillus helveticus]NRO05191.1 hypothetical protein [Lactobacillus helveticus]NRO19319.1 hypothetical protein [Lactobacillus helveticus]PXZ09173.1 hypothetical protein DM473_09425 [Lactobacillus helveticus]GFP07412.1 hypothetical protein LHEJCM1005_17040 [Lactobacillus helveticus]
MTSKKGEFILKKNPPKIDMFYLIPIKSSKKNMHWLCLKSYSKNDKKIVVHTIFNSAVYEGERHANKTASKWCVKIHTFDQLQKAWKYINDWNKCPKDKNVMNFDYKAWLRKNKKDLKKLEDKQDLSIPENCCKNLGVIEFSDSFSYNFDDSKFDAIRVWIKR